MYRKSTKILCRVQNFSSRRGWFKGHFETFITIQGEPQKLYTAVMSIVPGFDLFLLHVQDSGYKFASAPFSSRPRLILKKVLTTLTHFSISIDDFIPIYVDSADMVKLKIYSKIPMKKDIFRWGDPLRIISFLHLTRALSLPFLPSRSQ